MTDDDADCLLHRFSQVRVVFVVEKNYIPNSTLSRNSIGCSTTVVGFELANLNHVLVHYLKHYWKSKQLLLPWIMIWVREKWQLLLTLHVFRQLCRRIRKSEFWESDSCQQKNLQSAKIEVIRNDVLIIFIEIEKQFKLVTCQFTQKIDFNNILKTVATIPWLQPAMKNIEAVCKICVEQCGTDCSAVRTCTFSFICQR